MKTTCRSRTRCVFVSFLFFFLRFTSFAEGVLPSGPQFTSRVWQTDDGLPANPVQSILQTSDGYLWVGTSEGLARFDGVHFTLMEHPDAPELKNAWCSALLEAKDGAVWIGTDGKGALRLKDGRISRFTRTNGMAGDSVRALCQTQDGSIWIGTGQGLNRFQHGTFSTFRATNGLSHDVVRALCEDQSGTLWVGTGGGLDGLRNGAVASSFKYDRRETNGLQHSSVRSLFADRDGSLWIGGNSGASRFKDGKFTNYTTSDGLLDGNISSVLRDSTGALWMGTYAGLNRFASGGFVTHTNEGAGFYEIVLSLCEDREGDVWVGTKAGLYRMKPRYFSAITKQQGLIHNTTVSVLESKDGGLWIGTWGGGIDQIKNGEFVRHPASEVLPYYFALGLCEDRASNLWFGSDFNNGLYRRPPNGHIERWGPEHGMTDAALSAFCEDHAGNIWIGARTGLLRFRDGQWQHFGVQDGLPSDFVKVIFEDHEGNLWIGTVNGLAQFRDGKFVSFTTKDGLSSNAIFALYEDAAGCLWIGTKGGGLCRRPVRSSSRQFTAYTSHEGLFSDDVFEILEHEGFFWMSCAKGIFRIRKSQFDDFDARKISRLTCISYDKSDGLIAVDCKGVAKPSACKTRDGRLWFPTSKGLVIVEPNITINERPPTVVVEQIVADKKPIGDLVTHHLSPVTILPGRGELEFHYTALSFPAPEKNRFKYKLEGVDGDWVDAAGRRVAYYNNIPPGNYRFHVMACNNDGIWNETGAVLSFILLPHFWQTWWFKVAIAAVGVASLVGLYKLRVAQWRKLENLRVRIAADLHDEVGSSLWSISLLSDLLQKNQSLSEDDRGDAAEINRIARQTANSVRDIVWFIKPEYDTMQDLVLRMRDVAGTLLIGIEHRFQNTQSDMSRKLPLDFRQNVFLMYKEILTNIAKHSKATCVDIDISENQNVWRLQIRDNGVGFNPADAHNGSGVKNLRRRAEKLKGQLQISSRSGAGATVIFSVQL